MKKGIYLLGLGIETIRTTFCLTDGKSEHLVLCIFTDIGIGTVSSGCKAVVDLSRFNLGSFSCRERGVEESVVCEVPDTVGGSVIAVEPGTEDGILIIVWVDIQTIDGSTFLGVVVEEWVVDDIHGEKETGRTVKDLPEERLYFEI